MKTYLIKVFLEGIKIQFTLESEPISVTEMLHQKVLDFLGKTSKEQLEKMISPKQISNFFYITYEEVERDIIVPITSGQENRLGITVEQVLSWTGKTNDWYAVVRRWVEGSQKTNSSTGSWSR